MDVIVRTRLGDVRGSDVAGVRVFKGVPFAAPPFGANHLRPPRPREAWSGVRDATAWGAEPPQPKSDLGGMVPDPAAVGEDCLNLTIWSPANGEAKAPVMVWIPGGMFEVAAAATYDGSRFARDGVVCVAIHYRVGAEGFLHLVDGDANLGLLDQIAALEWVRDNIAAFGGDPGNVTIFGESAGAMSVGALLSMPRAHGLFRRAIAESGAADRVLTAAAALRIGRELAARLGVSATREAMAAVPWERILAAQMAMKAELVAHPDPARWGDDVVASMLPFQPVIDGEVLPAPPIDRIAGGSAAGVDVIVGTNTEDWRLFAMMNGFVDGATDATLRGRVADVGCQSVAAYGLPVDETLAAYRAIYPLARPGDLLAAIQTDWWCRIPALRLAEAHAGNRAAATFMYEMAWPSPMAGGVFGACHALEIPFVFDTLDKGPNQMVGPMLGGAPPQALATAMHGAWVAFARTGDPGWPKYDARRRATMRFDTTSRVIDDPRAAERTLWTRLWTPAWGRSAVAEARAPL